jgi:hypothetical protein
MKDGRSGSRSATPRQADEGQGVNVVPHAEAVGDSPIGGDGLEGRKAGSDERQLQDLLADSDTPNSRPISSRTISRVHSANSNCRGSATAISVYSRRICSPDNFGGRPGTGRALSASLPPSRYFASQPYTVPRPMPNDAATSSGCTPDSTASTARSRIDSSVLWSSLRPSFSRTRHCCRIRRSSQLTNVPVGR